MEKIKVFNKKNKEKKSDILEDLEQITKYRQNKQEKKSTVVIEFPTWMIISILLIVALIFFGKELLAIGVFLFMAFILMSALKPIVNWFTDKGLSKGWSITLTYFLLALVIVGLIALVIVPFGKSLQELISVLPTWVSNFLEDFEGITFGSFSIDREWFVDLADSFTSFLTPSESINSLRGIADTIGGVFNSATLFVAIVIFSVYLLSDGDQLIELGLLRITDDKKRNRVKKLIGDVQEKLGRWMLGQATISAIAGITLGIVLKLLNIPFALPLGVLVSLLGTIPTIGTTVATIPAVLVALISGGWAKAILILAIYVVYQQIENNILIPRIMGNAVGLKPIVVLLGVIVFLNLFGVWGALLAVPVMVVVGILYEFFVDLQKLEAEGIV